MMGRTSGLSAQLAPMLLAMLVVTLAGCALEEQSRADFERHNQSILRDSYTNPDVLVFEAKAGAAMPADSKSAEATRMQWLDTWLTQRKLCPAGHEIVSRQAIAPGEPNFHDMNLRYLVRCTDQPAPEASESPTSR
ncbi:MAG: hypothetical protein WBP60_13240 [Gammaproteobacteria bacterium]